MANFPYAPTGIDQSNICNWRACRDIRMLHQILLSSQSEDTELLRAAEHPAKIVLTILQGFSNSPTGCCSRHATLELCV